jgi:hypothetical protein
MAPPYRDEVALHVLKKIEAAVQFDTKVAPGLHA